MEEELESFIRRKIGLGEDTQSHRDERLGEFAIRVNRIYTEDAKDVYVEVSIRGGLHELSHLNTIRDLVVGVDDGRTRLFYLVCKGFDEGIEHMADRLGIGTIRVPFDIRMPRARRAGRMDITKDKSWKVVHELIVRGESSIRGLSVATGVSYAWTHNIVQNLIDDDKVERIDSRIRMKDVSGVLSSIPMRRPLKRMLVDEFEVDGTSTLWVARSMTDGVNVSKIRIAFTGLLAGGIHSGTGIPHDRLDAYMDPSDIEMFKDLFETRGGGIQIRIYRPDRDVLGESVLRSAIQLVSESQTMLDLAGMGRESMGILQAMVGERDR